MDPTDGQLGVTVTVGPDASALLAVSGEVDIDTAPRLRQAIDEVVSEGVGRVVFDLSDVEFMDSSGISLLLETRSVVAVALRHPTAMVVRLIEATGLTDVLEIES